MPAPPAGVAFIVILFASVWMRYSRRGPLEWTWHWCLTALTSQRRGAVDRS